ncbi:MAG: class I SAM-dependent methyltransferase [Candidatus Lokiarchaeota archaeon]|nr:class I SAM-dependent methyltransferase [Candidatus Lokiarchaeota archaeon]
MENENSLYFDGRYYDAIVKSLDQFHDLNFYLEIAKLYGGKILELGSGTGRLTIPIARAGFSISGLELEVRLIEQAKNKTKNEELNIPWIKGDMTNFKLEKSFDLIFIAFNTFSHLLTRVDIENCLKSVKNHLSKEGVFIIDTFNPFLRTLIKDPSEIRPYTSFSDPDSVKICDVFESNSYEISTQINHLKYKFKIGINEFLRFAHCRMVFPQELDSLMHYNGFKILYKYGTHAKHPFGNDSYAQIIICQKI